jgi:hypothetical protein
LPSHTHRSVIRRGRRRPGVVHRNRGLQRFGWDGEHGPFDARRTRHRFPDSDSGGIYVSDCDSLADAPRFSVSDPGDIYVSNCVANLLSDCDTLRDSASFRDSDPDS